MSQRSIASAFARWKCPTCTRRTTPTATRLFATTTAATSPIKPESPRYLPVQDPKQADRPYRPKIRGALPVPRNIFPRSTGGVDRVTKEALDAATPLPPTARTAPASAPTATRAHIAFKTAMASHRRRNLRAGLTELAERRRRTDAVVEARRARRREERARIDAQPIREDERLTATTVPAALAEFHEAVLPDPDREARVAAMRGRVARKEAARAEGRQAALHTLYMHARDFIVSEEQLDKHIDEVFGTPERPAGFKRGGSSIWSEGTPETVREKLEKAIRAQDGQLEEDGGTGSLTSRRVGRLAEELTGGKMDSNF